MAFISLGASDYASQSRPDSVSVTDTAFGPILREQEIPDAIEDVIAVAMRVVGAVAILLALAFWFVPDLYPEGRMPAMRLLLSGALTALGLLLMDASRMAEVGEVQFDVRRREIRFAVRRGAGRARLMASVAMDHVHAIKVEPVLPDSEYAEMRLAVDGTGEGLLVVSGRRAELERVAARLRRDIRRPSRRISVLIGG